MLFVPGLILALGAGYVFSVIYGKAFGIFIGSIVVFLGATIGSILAFFLGRYVFRDYIK